MISEFSVLYILFHTDFTVVVTSGGIVVNCKQNRERVSLGLRLLFFQILRFLKLLQTFF